jgi:hypothetical protein
MTTICETPFHLDLQKPVRTLACARCGGKFQGRQFHNQDTGWGLGRCCASWMKIRSSEDVEAVYGLDGVHYNLDPLARVYSLATPVALSTWRITQNVTDRWGDINESSDAQHLKGMLKGDPEMFERLQLQMFEEDTFIVRKDGVWGVLFELEFCSRESEANLDSPEENAKRPPRDLVITNLIADLLVMQGQFPGVHFTVPDPENVYEGRPAVWAFVPDGLLEDPQREALARMLQSMSG